MVEGSNPLNDECRKRLRHELLLEVAVGCCSAEDLVLRLRLSGDNPCKQGELISSVMITQRSSCIELPSVL